MGLREDQKELTRQTVLSAVLDLVADGSLDELSVPAVSRRSGVSLATIYRHFPTKDQLLVAAAAEPSRQALDSAHRPAVRESDDEFAAYLRAMWHEFVLNLPLLRHQISSQAGREMRRARLDSGRDRLASYVAHHGVEPDTSEGQRLISMIMLLTSSPALVELNDRQAMPIDEAIDGALWAVDALIAAAGGARPAPIRPAIQSADSNATVGDTR